MANHKHDVCLMDGCERKHKARGLCNPHYMESRRNGEFTPKPWTKPMEERKRPRRDPVSGEILEPEIIVDPNGFWDFVRKEMQL
jgi:hypothetical protein